MDEKSFRSMKSDLSRQKQQVKSKIVYSCNTHYPKYQSVANALLASGDQLALARGPLSALQTDVESLDASAMEERQVFALKLEELESVRHRKKVFLFLADCERKLVWLETELEKPDNFTHSATDLQSKTKTELNTNHIQQLEHVSIFYALLTAPVHMYSSKYPILHNIIMDRLDRVKLTCENAAKVYLKQIITQYLKTGIVNLSNIQACARAFQYLDLWPQFLIEFITGLIDPCLIQAQNVNNSVMSMYLTNVISVLNTKCIPLCKILNPHVGKRLYTSLTHHIVLRLIEALDARLTTNHYSPSVTTTFHSNYTSVVKFIHDVVVSLNMVTHIDRIPELHTYMRKWPVDTYYQLVARQMCTDVELNPSNSDVIKSAINKISDLYLPTLVHRFYKLLIQIVYRHHHALLQMDIRNALDAVTCMTDLHTTHRTIQASRLLNKNDTIRNSVVPILEDGLKSLELKWQACIERELVHAANDILKQTRSIAAQYRATGQPLPTTPSVFIAETFTATIDLVSDTTLIRFWEKVVPQVILKTCRAYADLVQDLLTTLKKTEESLRRLKQAKRTNSSAKDIGVSVGPTDEDKIRAQIAMDVNALASEIERVPYARAQETVELALKPVNDVLLQFQIIV